MSEARYLHLIRQDCPLPKGTRVVGYCRDSGGEEQDRSTKQQADVIIEYCAHFGLILERIYSDDARQASSTEKRTNLKELLLDLHNRFKPINDRHKRAKKMEKDPFGIIFWKSNRLGRDSVETRSSRPIYGCAASQSLNLIREAARVTLGLTRCWRRSRNGRMKPSSTTPDRMPVAAWRR